MRAHAVCSVLQESRVNTAAAH